jgi:hypothetical protein
MSDTDDKEWDTLPGSAVPDSEHHLVQGAYIPAVSMHRRQFSYDLALENNF